MRFSCDFELGDVLTRRDVRMLPGFDRVLFGGQTERIPAHRMQHVETAQPFVARDDVGGGVTFRMADMQSRAARIREHVEHIKFRFRRIEIFFAGIRSVKGAPFFPDRSAILARSDRMDKVCAVRSCEDRQDSV